MGEIIEIGAGKFERKWQERCPHNYLFYDPKEETVTCKDCKRDIHGFKAFLILLFRWQEAEDKLKSRYAELEELEKRVNKGLLKATKKVDHAWRRNNSVPVCPHCNEAIFIEDGFGNHTIGKDFAIKKRHISSLNRSG